MDKTVQTRLTWFLKPPRLVGVFPSAGSGLRAVAVGAGGEHRDRPAGRVTWEEAGLVGWGPGCLEGPFPPDL